MNGENAAHGKGLTIKIYNEFMSYYNYENTDKTFDKYVLEGGFSGSYLYKNLDEKYKYISDV